MMRERRHAERPRRLDIGQFADDQRRGAHDAGEPRRVDDAERDDDRGQRRPERRDERDGEQDVGKRHHGVDDAGDRRVEAAEEAGDEAERDAEERPRTTTTRSADEQREPAGIDACGVKTSRPNSSVPNQ